MHSSHLLSRCIICRRCGPCLCRFLTILPAAPPSALLAVVDTPLLPLTPEQLVAGTTLPQPGGSPAPARPSPAGQGGGAGTSAGATGSAAGGSCVPTGQLFQSTPEFSAWARMVNASGVLVRT